MTMEYAVIPLDQVDDKQLLELARLHHAVLHSLLSELGLPFLERYYQIAKKDATVVGFCVVSKDGVPLGWVCGSPKPDRLNGQLREPLTWFVYQILRLLFISPLVLWQLMLSVLSSSNQPDMKKDAVELTYIGVSRDYSGIGLGKKLMDHFIEASREAKYHSVALSVEVDNKSAIALYKKTGFEVTHTFSEGRFQRYRMELMI